jgi:hypothetical protein
MAKKRKRRRGNGGGEQSTGKLLTEALRLQTRMLALLEYGERRRNRPRSPRAAATAPLVSPPVSQKRAVLKARADVQAGWNWTQGSWPPFPPLPPQTLPIPPPPPLPEQQPGGEGWGVEADHETLRVVDERLVRLIAETIRAMGQEHVSV